MRSEQRCLLIGNSRWHWAECSRSGVWSYRHAQPHPSGLAGSPRLCAWAAVGPVPDHSVLSPDSRLGLDAIPLRNMPPWLGIDRALAGWGAWVQAAQVGPVMVVDANKDIRDMTELFHVISSNINTKDDEKENAPVESLDNNKSKRPIDKNSVQAPPKRPSILRDSSF